MEANQFDNNAKSRLSKHESQMDVDAFWEQLEPKLPRDKSRPKFFILLLIAGLLLCASLGGWYYLAKNKNTQDNRVANESIHTEMNEEVTKEVAFNTEGNVVVKQNELQPDVPKSEFKMSQSNNSRDLNQAEELKASNRDEIKRKSERNQFAQHEKPKTEVTKKMNSASQEEKHYTSVKLNSHDNATVSKQFKNAEPGNSNSKTDSNKRLNQTAQQNQKSEPIDEPLIPDPLSAFSNNEVTSVSMLPVLLSELEFEEKNLMLNNSLPELEFVHRVADPKKNKIGLQIIPFVGIGFYDKKLNGDGSDELQNYVQVRNELESNLEEWALGLNFNVTYKRFGFLTGVEYLRRNERFEYISTIEENHFGNTAIRIESRDTVLTGSGQGWYGTTKQRKVTHYNSIQQWNIPLGINYTFALKHFQLNVGGGAMFSLNNAIDGKTIDSNLNIAEWNQSADLVSKSNLGVGWFADLGCTIPMSKHTAFNAGIRVQEFPGNYLNGPLRLEYRSYFFRTGLIFKFN